MTQKMVALRSEYLPNHHNLRATLVACTLVVVDLAVCVTLLVFANALAELGTFAPTYHLFPIDLHRVDALWDWPAMVALCWLIAHFAGRGHYRSRIPFWNEIGTVIAGATIAFAIDTALDVVVMRQRAGIQDVASWVLLVPALLAGRQAARLMLDQCGCWRRRTVIIGDPSAIESVELALRSEPALGYELVGHIPVAEVGDPEPLGSWLDRLRVDRAEFVILALGGGSAEQERMVTSTLTRLQVDFAVMPSFGGLPVVGFKQHYFFSHDVLLLGRTRPAVWSIGRASKILFDKLAALLLLVLLLPLLIVIASMVRADGGPALFGHRRIGANGLPFRCFKFRTMVTDADRVLRDLLKSNAAARAEWVETQKLRNDPRVTRIGHFLRKTSLDELPQLLNVLRGEMSLVGPRPIVEAEIVRYGRDIDLYYSTRPGMTGLWQVSGRSDTSYQRRVQLDTWYVKNWSLWHDIAILLKTIPAVLSKDGAM